MQISYGRNAIEKSKRWLSLSVTCASTYKCQANDCLLSQAADDLPLSMTDLQDRSKRQIAAPRNSHRQLSERRDHDREATNIPNTVGPTKASPTDLSSHVIITDTVPGIPRHMSSGMPKTAR